MKYIIIAMFVLTGCASAERKAYKDGCADVYTYLLTDLDWKYSPKMLDDYCDMKAQEYILEHKQYKDMNVLP